MTALIRRPMTDDEKKATQILNLCTFTPASYNKRFARDMESIARSDDAQITERQGRVLWKLFYMYRRQIRGRVEIVGNKRLLDYAESIYKEERARERQPSWDDQQRLKEWNEATK